MTEHVLSSDIPISPSKPWKRTLSSVALAGLVALATAAPSSAATITGTWQARVGPAGANGTARILGYATGTGTITLKLTRLKASTTLPVVIARGTCSTAGSVLLTLPSVRTSYTGSVARTSSLSASQLKLVVAATRGTGKIAIRIGSGATRKCGAFSATVLVAPAPAVVATIPVGISPQQVALTSTGVWVTNAYDQSLTRIDPATNSVLAIVPLVLPGITIPSGITTGFGSIWVSLVTYDSGGTTLLPGVVARLDPATGAVQGSPIAVGRGSDFIAASPEAIWVSNYADGTISRIDPTTNQVAATVTIGGSPFGMAAGFGSLWVANENDGKVSRLDPATNQVTASVQTHDNAESLVVAAGAVWVSYYGAKDQPGGVVSRIDPATNSVVAAVSVGTNPVYLASGGGYVWVALEGEASIVQINPATNAIVHRVAVGAKSEGIAASDHAVWVVHETAAGADPSALIPGSLTRIAF
jgi:YVTN family beta-propeller protein